jgi:hypothetical protein
MTGMVEQTLLEIIIKENNMKNKREDMGDIIGGTIVIIVLIAVLLFAVIHPILLYCFKVGLPDEELYQLKISQIHHELVISDSWPNTSVIFCKDFKEIKDYDDGKVIDNVIITQEVYEAKLFHYVKTTQKSFFNYQVYNVERYNVKDEYFIK